MLPVAILAVTKLIIDSIVHASAAHQPVQPRFWWLVVAEFVLAGLITILTRIIDYLDSLLADRYTRYVSIEVMKHAAELDLIAYEDPVFYDRLDRARVQATDRLAMIQSIGRLITQVITAVSMSVSIMVFSPWLMLFADRRRGSRVSRRDALCISWIRQEFSPDSGSPPARLPAPAREEAARLPKNFDSSD